MQAIKSRTFTEKKRAQAVQLFGLHTDHAYHLSTRVTKIMLETLQHAGMVMKKEKKFDSCITTG